MNIDEYLPRRSRGKYSSIFTETEVNNCFSKITEVNIEFVQTNTRFRVKMVLLCDCDMVRTRGG